MEIFIGMLVVMWTIDFAPMIGENRQLIINEPAEFEK
jgi:hypothetical protein